MKRKTLITGILFTVLTAGAVTSAFAMGHGYGGRGFRDMDSTYCQGYNSISRLRGYELSENILKEKYDLTQEYLDEKYDNGTTLKDILSDNKIDEDEFKGHFLDARNAEVDAAVEAGDITAEEGATIKENLKSHMEEYDITSHMRHRSTSRSSRGFGRGRGRGGCH